MVRELPAGFAEATLTFNNSNSYASPSVNYNVWASTEAGLQWFFSNWSGARGGGPPNDKEDANMTRLIWGPTAYGNCAAETSVGGGGNWSGFMYFQRPAGVNFGPGTTLYMEVDLLDLGGPGSFSCQYNAVGNAFQNGNYGFNRGIDTSGVLKTAVFRLDNTAFAYAENGGNDLRLAKNGNPRMHFLRVVPFILCGISMGHNTNTLMEGALYLSCRRNSTPWRYAAFATMVMPYLSARAMVCA